MATCYDGYQRRWLLISFERMWHRHRAGHRETGYDGYQRRWLLMSISVRLKGSSDIFRAQVALASGDSPAAKAPPPTLPGQAQNVSNKRQPQINHELAPPPPKVGRTDNYSPQASSPRSRVTTNAVPVPQNAPTAHGPVPQNGGPWPKANFANFRRRVPVMTNEEESGFE